MITKHFSGHTYFNSPYETDDDCGTCSGARCDTCKEIWTVSNSDEKFFNMKDAQSREDLICSLIPLDKSTFYDISYFYIKDEKLVVDVILKDHCNEITIECNLNSSIYEAKYKEAVERKEIFGSCLCTDKNEDIEEPCYKYGCTDNQCYKEMIHHKRTKKKLYL
jgi:hypothetical protein